MSKYVLYVRLAIMGIKLLQALFAKRATPDTREAAIKSALGATNAILPATKLYTDSVTPDDVAAVAELADILAEWQPNE